MKKTDFELLLPVGQLEMALAAIHNGADAIFVGFPGFNARGRSYDFEISELKEIIETCHLFGVKVNLAFNIVIFQNEIEKVVSALKEVLPLKPDALIIQDLGLVQIVRKMAPDQPIHASTQMTVSNDLAIELLNDLNIKRFVLARENSLSEIQSISERTTKELEVFVHGALCVSYSGQCFTSETLGGRSANRGQCAQSCRFSYELIVDGEKKQLVDQTYLVSPQDLCGISEIPQLMKIGVKSFKVEGRLKTPEFVASVAKSFRHAIDSVLNEKPLSALQIEKEKTSMAVQYSRGFFPGWLNGVNHQELVNGTFSSHRGALIGKITNVNNFEITVQLDKPLQLENGDGLLWVEKNQNKGSFIFSVQKISDQKYKLGLSNDSGITMSALDSNLYLNHDKDQKKEIQKSYSDKNYSKKINLKFKIELSLGQSMKAVVTDGRFEFTDQSESVIAKADKKPLTKELIQDEFLSLANTAFTSTAKDIEVIFDGPNLFLNHKEIKNIRQRLVQKIEFARKSHFVDPIDFKKLNDFKIQTTSDVPSVKIPKLNILLRNKNQVRDLTLAIEKNEIKPAHINTVCFDFEFGRDYSDSIAEIKKLNIPAGIATTRILKPQELQNLKIIHSLNPDFILVRNLGALHYFTKINPFSGKLKGDFSLNVTNSLTADYLLSKGLDSVCISYDLNFEQTLGLLENTNSAKIEITVHQSMPSFHMEHCVFAAFLSKGKSFKDCGKPCEKHHVQLKDQFGNHHWIKPDHECRNTMYNASAQTALPYLPAWQKLGLGEIRFEALHESGADLISKIKNYISVLNNEQSIESAMTNLKTSESYGLSTRQLGKSVEYESRKKDHSFISKRTD
jgi:U32 family peptidase